MPDDPRVELLLEELIASQGIPEEVCGSCPELLPLVRARWKEMRRAQAEIEALFPQMTERDPGTVAAPAGDMPLPVIPGYEVEAVLGVGGMGVVFKARHLGLNRIVALKMALAGAYAGTAERERFRREAEAVAALRHPNIVQVHDVGESDGRPYFTMEYVEGGSLAQKLAGTPQPAREAATLVATLAGAVHAAHESGIIHRDLKPGNVLLTAEGTPKVTDFGLARRLGGEAGLTQSGTALGTPSYMAPEQARAQASAVGPAVDVYALGAILYECLTGRPPFRAETVAETVLQVLHQDPVPPSWLNGNVPRDLETICLKCLHKEPQRRYASAAALAEDLQRYLLGQVVEARPVGLLERAGKWIRRNKWVAGLSAAAVFALLAGTVVSLLFAFEARRQEGLATQRAGELERQTNELKAQTLAAKEKAEEVRRIFITSLMIPIEGNPHKLNAALENWEVVGLCQLRKAPREIRLQFLETALRNPDTARRIGRRADGVIQAIVGCDRPLHDEVSQLLVQHIQKPETAPEVLFACARLGQGVNLEVRGCAERSADALSTALSDKELPHEDCRALAESLKAVSEHLPRAQAAEHAARATDVLLARLQGPTGRTNGYVNIAPAIEVMSPQLDAVAANRTAKTLNTILRDFEYAGGSWAFLARAQLAVCQRLPPSDSAAHINKMVDILLEFRRATKESDKFTYAVHAQSWGILSGQLDAKVAGRVADVLIATLGDSYMTGGIRKEFIEDAATAEALAKVAERLDAASSLRAAEALLPLLKNTDSVRWNFEPLKKALVGVCRRLDADGARRVADAIQDPKTPVLCRALMANGFAVFADKLDPDKVASLESAIVDVLVADLADTKVPMARLQLGQALGLVCGRAGTKCASRAAEALTATLRDPQTHPSMVRPLAAALAAVSAQLPAEQASARASKAAEILLSVRAKPLDRPAIAQAIAEVWTLLGPQERASHARRLAVDLGDAFQDAKTEPTVLKYLAEALTTVCSQLDPAEEQARLNSALDILDARFRKSRNEAWKDARLTEALMTLWLRLDRNGLARAVDTLVTALGDSDRQRFWLEQHIEIFKKLAARLDERDLERLLDQPMTMRVVQQAILDVLGEAKKRTFRNTWDYLDWRDQRDATRAVR
jgi:hypothetical protein